MKYSGTVGFAGAGKMGGILMQGIASSGMVQKKKLFFYEKDKARAGEISAATGAAAMDSVKDVVRKSDIFFICVKPDQFEGVSAEIRESWPAKKPCLVSIMAGVKTSRIRELTTGDAPVIRVMPNVACVVKKGIAGVASDPAAPVEVNRFVFDLFVELGGAVWTAESKMDAVTAISGSGPAYVFMFIEALTDAGVAIGLDRQTAHTLAVKTVAGAAAMVSETQHDTLQLRAQVSSPGGTTVAGTSVLEKSGFRSAVIEAARAAWLRAVELGG